MALCRELTHYKGEPDPFKGDTPNQKVREFAKEALDAVFSATDISYSASASSGSQLQVRPAADHRWLLHLACMQPPARIAIS